jgi:hypothetical protein
MVKHGFEAVDTLDGGYELLALSFDGSKPSFSAEAKRPAIDDTALTIYYGQQCPYIPDCITQIENYCKANAVPLNLIAVDTLDAAKRVPCVFNNWAVFYQGRFETVQLLNEGSLKKLLSAV